MKSRNDVPENMMKRITEKMREQLLSKDGMRLVCATSLIVRETNLPISEADRLADRIIQRWRRNGLLKLERKGRITSWHPAPEIDVNALV